MKKTFITIAIITISLFAVYSYNRTIEETDTKEGIYFFEGTWQQALEKAKKENKMIFLDAYASWCGPCKMMKRKTFTNKKVGEFYNKNFINIAIDMEKGEGIALSQKFQITGYPTLIYLNANGKTIVITMGFRRAKDFLELGESIVKHSEKQ